MEAGPDGVPDLFGFAATDQPHPSPSDIHPNNADQPHPARPAIEDEADQPHPARPAFEDEAVQAEAGAWGRQPPADPGSNAQH
ncbi:hypothetical protein GCM10010313_45850 [Streptomyces violarus]|nr:hypothetical protein GCM10010313_45850 [Streptomyces violarus]